MSRQAGETAQNFSEQYHTLINLLPGMVYEARAGEPVMAISGLELVCGYAPEDFASKALTWNDLIYPLDRGQVAEEERAGCFCSPTLKSATMMKKYTSNVNR